jgi:hypothetical protein
MVGHFLVLLNFEPRGFPSFVFVIYLDQFRSVHLVLLQKLFPDFGLVDSRNMNDRLAMHVMLVSVPKDKHVHDNAVVIKQLRKCDL